MRNSPNFRVLNEPRGFIKILEVLLAIFAFSCATGYRGHLEITQTQTHQSTPSVSKATFSYPFDTPVELSVYKNGTKISISLPLNQRSSTEFFVVIGVFCFLYSLIILIYYVMFEEDNAPNSASGMFSLPVIDFCAGAFWALFWFFSSCAIAAATNGIKKATDIKGKFENEDVCKGDFTCVFVEAKYAALTIAILLGFLNVFVWSGNIWFLWKETPWHAANHKNQPATLGGQSHQSTPPAAAI